ncbi:FAD:protein FMN transferase [Williamsia deligens]|uniref:FAD:protein FMN transferase n=1 Tax=Williamsia deligens TaxID=321325 RepID=A0ABW3G4V9_9NOCA|nr:FAD:protein FMN transferase [Williamsia deligens]MCP2193578.1 thiamine biosynthesis lipoprotein [Williamsia deligens]
MRTATSEWQVWCLDASVTVTDPGLRADARAIVETVLADVDRACSRFRPDSEITSASLRRGRPTRISPMLAALVDAGLRAARMSGGAVDPTIGRRLVALGYDRDLAAVKDPGTRGGPTSPAGTARFAAHRAHAGMISRRGDVLTVPEGISLDLGATAKAVAADLAADVAARQLQSGVLVDLGGDIATRGVAPVGGWQVVVDDGPGQPTAQIAVGGDCGIATSSTLHRRWRDGDGIERHHIIDPRTGFPADEVWRTVTVVARRCVDANTASTACIVNGSRGADLVRGTGLPARLVAADGSVTLIGGWPHDRAVAA